MSERIEEHIPALRKLHQKYRDRPMSLADACIMRMTEISEQYAVLTLDSDFTVYRKHGRELSGSFFPRKVGVLLRDVAALARSDAVNTSRGSGCS